MRGDLACGLARCVPGACHAAWTADMAFMALLFVEQADELFGHRATQNCHSARIGFKYIQDNANRSCFSCAIWPQQTKYFSPRYVERNIFYSLETPVKNIQVIYL